MASTDRRRASWLAAGAGLLLASGCSSAPERADSSSEPTVVHVGAGSPQAIAQRSAVALVDAPRLAEACSRWDARFLVRFDDSVRFDEDEPAGSGSLGRYREIVRAALLGTGRFLVTEEDAAPSVVVDIHGPLGDERSDVLVEGPQGELWVRVCGTVTGPH